ncbi:hypothetical protein, partial [Escherichia coli]|uniref:hypothetical protein n=1 Tax=Escherichia coli TaxID=562 RepID=UPI00019F3965
GTTTNAASAESSPVNVKVELITRGTPQRVAQQSQQTAGKDVLVRMILEDVAVGGPIIRGIQGAQSRG